MTRFFRVGILLLALSAITSAAFAAPYQRTEELRYTITSATKNPNSTTRWTGYTSFTPSPTVATYATDSTVRNWASGQRLDTLYFRKPADLAILRSTSGALADSIPLFTIWAVPDPGSAITVTADSFYITPAATVGGGPAGAAGTWIAGQTIPELESGTSNIFAKTWTFNGLFGTPPTTTTDVTLGLYDTFRIIMQSDAAGSYKYYLTYLAESTLPHVPIQN